MSYARIYFPMHFVYLTCYHSIYRFYTWYSQTITEISFELTETQFLPWY